MKNAIIILVISLILSYVIPDPFGAKVTSNLGIFMAIGLLLKELRKPKDK